MLTSQGFQLDAYIDLVPGCLCESVCHLYIYGQTEQHDLCLGVEQVNRVGSHDHMYNDKTESLSIPNTGDASALPAVWQPAPR